MTGRFVIGVVRRSTEDNGLIAVRIGSGEIDRRHLIIGHYYRHLTDLYDMGCLLVGHREARTRHECYTRREDIHTLFAFGEDQALALDSGKVSTLRHEVGVLRNS